MKRIIPQEFRVRVTSKDFADSTYFSNTNCSLAKALKRKFPKAEISVGGTSVTIDDVVFDIDYNSSNEIVRRTYSNIPVRGMLVTLTKEVKD